MKVCVSQSVKAAAPLVPASLHPYLNKLAG
jgi:hypothetical protein